MKWSFKIFSIAGIEIKIHLTLLIILAILIYVLYSVNPFPVGFKDLEYSSRIKMALSVIASVGLFVAVLLHELAHSLLSKRSGVEVKGIMLFIFGGVSMLEEVPKESEKEVAIAFVGPLTSFIIAGLSYMLYLTHIKIVSEFFMVFGMFNFVLGAFNLIPAFPLDGGRIIRGVLTKRMGFIKATQTAASLGKTLAFFMGIFGLVALSPWLILIALFIYMGANEEERMAVIEGSLSGSRVRDIMTPNPVTVPPDMKVKEFIELMLKQKHLGYPVMENNKMIGIITLNDVSNVPEDKEVRELMTKKVISVSPDVSTYEAFKIINEKNIGRLIVEENGNIVGIVSRTDLMRLLEVIGAIHSGR